MNGKVKMVAVMASLFAVLSVAFLAAPALASANGTVYTEQDQTQEQERLRIHNQDGSCAGNCTMTQTKERLHLGTEQSCTGALEQYKYQYSNRFGQNP